MGAFLIFYDGIPNSIGGKPIIISLDGKTKLMDVKIYKNHVLFLKRIFREKPDQVSAVLTELRRAMSELSVIVRLFRVMFWVSFYHTGVVWLNRYLDFIKA